MNFLKCFFVFSAIGLSSVSEAGLSCKSILNSGQKTHKMTQEAYTRVQKLRSEQQEAFLPLVESYTSYVRSRSQFKINRLIKSESKKIVYEEHIADSWNTFPPALKEYMFAGGSANQVMSKMLSPISFSTQQFLWRKETKGSKATLHYAMTPVGEYSPLLYKKLVTATGVLLELAHSGSWSVSRVQKQIEKSDVAFARKVDEMSLINEKGSVEKPGLLALEEGVLSLHQLITLMLSSKIEGLSGEQLVEKLLSTDKGASTVSTITRFLPMGFVGPSTLRGSFVKNPLKVGKGGKLVPSKHFMDFLKDFRGKATSAVNEGMAHVTCKGCPMTQQISKDSSKNAIDLIAEVYLEVFKSLE